VIADWRLAIWAIGNRKLKFGNLVTHPLPRGGTDFISKPDRCFQIKSAMRK
jgi:hypothetical protein